MLIHMYSIASPNYGSSLVICELQSRGSDDLAQHVYEQIALSCTPVALEKKVPLQHSKPKFEGVVLIVVIHRKPIVSSAP